MEANQYHQILEEYMLPWEQHHLPATWWFQQDNDPKHKSGLMMAFEHLNFYVITDY
jgi:hypothetical protein